MELIDGNEIASAIVEELTNLVSSFGKTRPCVAFVRVGEDPASVSYVRKKGKNRRPDRNRQQVARFSRDHFPRRAFYGKSRYSTEIPAFTASWYKALCPVIWMTEPSSIMSAPSKDADGFNATNLGKLCQEDKDAFVSCTPAGIIELIRRKGIETEGKRVVVLGRSLIVGKPVGMLLGKGSSGNATLPIAIPELLISKSIP